MLQIFYCSVFVLQNEVVPSSAGSTAEEGVTENGGGGGGGGGRGKEGGEGDGGGGEDMSVQQILMPPDADFLSSFYEAAQVSLESTHLRCQFRLWVIPTYLALS